MSIGGIASQAFVPNKFLNLILWLDATDRATVIDSGGLVSQWIDKSRNSGDVTEGSATLQPIYTPGSINGLPSIVFDGADDILSGTFSSFSPIDGKTIITVFKSDTTVGTGIPILIGDISIDHQGFGFGAPQSGVRFNSFLFGGQHARTDFVNTDSNISIATIDMAGNSNLYINGVKSTLFFEIATAPNLVNRIAVGGIVGFPTFPYDGKIGEIIIYDRVITDLERLEIENYMFNKWNINTIFPFNFSLDFSSDFS